MEGMEGEKPVVLFDADKDKDQEIDPHKKAEEKAAFKFGEGEEVAEAKEVKKKKPEKKEKAKTIVKERTIFFKGQAIIIQEEISVESGDDSSVQTSVDDFSVDDDGVKEIYADRVDAPPELDEKTQKQVQTLQNSLSANLQDK